MKRAFNTDSGLFKGVSTLDAFDEKPKVTTSLRATLKIATSFLTLFCLFSAVSGGHSTLDLVDPAFNPEIITNTFGVKSVNTIVTLSNGKVLVGGSFNSYNRQPVHGIVRLNSDGSLDTTFNTNVIKPDGSVWKIALQDDGKLIVVGSIKLSTGESPIIKRVVRLEPDGSLDPTFDYVGEYRISDVAIDDNGRILLAGYYPDFASPVIRLTSDGSLDNTFNFNQSANLQMRWKVATFNNKVYCVYLDRLIRLNEDGTTDTTFTQRAFGHEIDTITTLPNGKILVLDNEFPENTVLRLNTDGTDDVSFTKIESSDAAKDFIVAADGNIFFSYVGTGGVAVRKFNADGIEDTSYDSYATTNYRTFGVQDDGSVIFGDQFGGGAGVSIPDHFVKLLPNGNIDLAFNEDGIGFQTLVAGDVNSIATQSDGKIIIGGLFDEVNDSTRFKIARLNSDSTIDETFEINTSGADNSFTNILDFDQITVQDDGKLLIIGAFAYLLNGTERYNFVRLNPDGSIDTTFSLSVPLQRPVKSVYQNDGKIVVATSRISSNSQNNVPVRLNSNASNDNSFTPTIFSDKSVISVNDIALQPDGKILIAGDHGVLISGPATIYNSFVARLNTDGSIDDTFQINEELDKSVSNIELLPNGKILVSQRAYQLPTVLKRINSDGTLDNSFFTGIGANGEINDLLSLPNGKIFIGGNFTSYNNQPRGNLAQLTSDGIVTTIEYNLDNEVLDLEIDDQERVLIGGRFLVFNANNNGNVNRTNLARLIDSQQAGNIRFDFDGDGRADIGTFNEATGSWGIYNTQSNRSTATQFGLTGDKTIPADFDGDGLSDIAIYRPSEGNWYINRSSQGFTIIRWGIAEDIPVSADFDGDRKADIAVWRPSTGVWYILRSLDNQPMIIKFGQTGDIPLQSADFDGDGKTDIAVWRPTTGNFYWLESDSSNNQFRVVRFGQMGDVPSVGDFNGDGKTDLVVFRPTEGIWYQYLTDKRGTYKFKSTRFGLDGDEPVAADYDGDGKCDIAIRRQNTWHLLLSNSGYSTVTFGDSNSTAIAALIDR